MAHEEDVNWVVFNNKKNIFASASDDCIIKIWSEAI